MNKKLSSLGQSLFEFLASLKLAVILLLIFVVLLSAATILESKTSTEEAQRLIYGTAWFDFLLFVLGINVLCSAMIRFPWKKKQIGFLITHAGILIILIGSLMTRKFGMEGQLMLSEGEVGDSIRMNQVALSVSAPQLNAFESFNPQKFMASGIPAGKALKYSIGDSGLVCYVNQYFSNPRQDESITNDGTSKNPAVRVALKRPELEQVSARDWLVASDPQRNVMDFGMAKVVFSRAETEEALANALKAPGQEDAATESKGSLAVKDASGETVTTFSLEQILKEPITFEYKGEQYAINEEQYFERAKVDGSELVNDPSSAVNPVIRLTINGPKGPEKHMAFALFPEFGSMHGGESAAGFNVTFQYNQDSGGSVQPENRLDLVYGPDDQLHYRTMNSGGFSANGIVKAGETLNTTWNNLGLLVEEVYPNARVESAIVDAGENAPGPHNNPLVHVRLENNTGGSAEGYVPFNSPRRMMVGSTPVTVEFGQRNYPLGFQIQLLDFRAPRYPGTNRPMRFESDVMLIDQANSVQRKQKVYMNNPLDYNNFKVYQSSYIEGQNGQPDVSIFTVAKAPGTPVIYVGSIVLCLGMIFIFGSKKYGYRKSSPFTTGQVIEGE
ncbi:MAG: hypothetical protein GC154_02725 [bacterium]|nr:hypothetical protein [bacterium]